jgi:hypothetical protein
MIRSLFLFRRRFDSDETSHVTNIKTLEDWADLVRQSLTSEADVDLVATGETRTTNSYGNLATTGPVLTIRVGPSGKLLITVSARIQAGASGAASMAFEIKDVDGNVVHAASDNDAARGDNASTTLTLQRTSLVTGLPRRQDVVVTAKYEGNGTDASTFTSRRLIVVPV